MSQILNRIKQTFVMIPMAMKLASVWVLIVFLGEGLQHVAEYKMGMFNSPEDFKAQQSSTNRLGFGIVKVISLLLAGYFIPKAFNKHYGTFTATNFRKTYLRMIYNPSGGISGLIAAILLCLPLIWIHSELNMIAMGSSYVLPILVVDSGIVAAIGLVFGITIWLDMPRLRPSNASLASARS